MITQEANSAWETMYNLARGAVASMWQMQQAGLMAATRSMNLMTDTYAKMWGLQVTEDVMPADRRFEDPAWSENLALDVLKQSYLITSQWMADSAESLAPIDPSLHQRAAFWTKQAADALSPTNLALTNPEVLEETIRTGGTNLVNGMQNFLSDMSKGRISQVPDDAFELGKDLAVTPGKVVYRNPLIELIQYTPTTKRVRPIPVLAMPPWINKYYIMDMRPDNSMYKHLVDAGFTLFTISWKNPDSSILDWEWADYMTQGPLEALRVIKEITGADRVNLVGYCLGGILLQVTLAYLAAVGDETPNTATFFATHQDFTNVGEIAAFISQPEVKFLEWLMDASGGYLDGRNMGATFNMLRANDLLWNYVIQNYLMGKEPPAFDLLYWNSDGTRVPGKVHSFLLREFFLENKLKEPNGITLEGVGIDVGRITVPSYCVAASGDHIVPWEGTFAMRHLHGGPVRFVLTGGGHIAGIINPPAKKKRGYRINESDTQDPQEWLVGAAQHEGSWWQDWVPWLKEHSGRQNMNPPAESASFPPIMDAPGTYVLEK